MVRSDKGGIGIHGAHVQGADMQYVATDQRRQEIPQVTYTDKNGKVTVFNSTDAKVTPEELARGEHRDMDCMDCHNRPTHTFQVPERALDLAMSQGSISPKLPFIKKQAVEALRRDYPDRDTGTREIAASHRQFLSNQLSADLRRGLRINQDARSAPCNRCTRRIYFLT